jgi:hypothetical protein
MIQARCAERVSDLHHVEWALSGPEKVKLKEKGVTCVLDTQFTTLFFITSRVLREGHGVCKQVIIPATDRQQPGGIHFHFTMKMSWFHSGTMDEPSPLGLEGLQEGPENAAPPQRCHGIVTRRANPSEPQNSHLRGTSTCRHAYRQHRMDSDALPARLGWVIRGLLLPLHLSSFLLIPPFCFI